MCRALLKGGILSALLLLTAAASFAQAVRLDISGPSSVTAGSAINLKITAVDASGKRARSYDGSKYLVFSGAQPSDDPQRMPTVTDANGNPVDFGQSVRIEFDKGVAEVKGTANGVMRLYRAGQTTVAATDGSLSTAGGGTLTVDVNPTALDRFSFSLSISQLSGVAFTGTNTLRALDQYGNTVTSFSASGNPVTITSSLSGSISGLGSGGNVLNGSGDFSSGVANLTGRLIFTGSGTGTFTARSQTGRTGVSGSVTVTAPAPTATRLRIQTQPSNSATAGVPFSQQPVIRIEDANGNIMSGDNSTVVRAERAAGTGILQGTVSVTAVNGMATFTNLSHTVAGDITIRFSSTPSLTTETSTTITVQAALTASLTFEQHPSNSLAGGIIAPPVTVRGRDAYGNPSPPADTITIALASGTGTLSGTTRRTADGGGLAVFNDLRVSDAGQKALSAQSGLLPVITSNIFTVSAPAARSITASAGTPQSARVGTAFATNLQCAVTNTNGEPLSGLTVTFTVPSTGPSGTFAGNINTAVTDANGLATAQTFTANMTAGSYEVRATAQGVNGSAIFQLTNTAGTLQSFSVEDTAGGPIGTHAAGEPFPVRITARDQGGQVVQDFTGTVDVSSNGTLSAGQGRTAAFVGGVDRAHYVAFAAPGTFMLSVQQTGGGVQGSSNSFNIVNPAPTITSIMPASGATGDTLTVTITGTGFIPNVTTVTFGDEIVTRTAVLDGTHLQVSLSIDPNASTGSRNVSVVNPPPGGGTATIQNGFAVTSAPSATVSSVTPSTGARLESVNVQIAGSHLPTVGIGVNFGQGIVVNALASYGTGRIDANITILAEAATGVRPLRIFSSAGDTLTVPDAFTVLNPVPLLTSLTPASVAVGRDTTLTVAGAKFITGVTSVSLGTGITINTLTVQSTGQMSVQISVASNAPLGQRPVVVTNSGPGGGVSSSIPLTVDLGDYPSMISIAGTVPFPSHDQASAYSPLDYRLVGLPGASNNALSAYLLGSSGSDWQVYWDDGSPGTGYLKAYDGSALFSFSVGKAFWLIKKQSWTFNVTVPSALPDSSGCVTIPLHAGWNLITNPLPSGVPWTSIQRYNDSLTEPIFAFSGGFSIADTMAPFAGYYFFNNGQRAGLRIPVVQPSGLIVGKVASPETDETDGPSWRIRIRLSSGSYDDYSTVFGVAPAASDGLDALDFRKPSRAPGLLPGLSFQHRDWDSLYSSFGSDIRHGIADTGFTTWEFHVTGKPGVPTVLGFEGVGRIPERYSVVVINEAEARGQDLRKGSRFSFTPMTAQTTFRVLVGAPAAVQRELDGVGPKSFALGSNYPNPFNPTTTIPVDLPAAQDLELTVYNALGQQVAVLFKGTLDAGRHYFTWNGRNAAGANVASGMYICRAVGTGNSAVRKMILVR